MVQSDNVAEPYARLDPLGEAAPLQQLEDHAEQPAAVQNLAGRTRQEFQGLRGSLELSWASSYVPPYRL